MDSLNVERFTRVAHKLDPNSRLLRARALHGGVSAQVTALEIVRADGQTQKLIVRQHGEADLRANPNIAADEFRLLRLLHSAELPVPLPYSVDAFGEIFPTPYLVMEYVEGESDFAPLDLPDHLRQMGHYLAEIHKLDSLMPELSFLPKQAERTARLLEPPTRVDESLDEGGIRLALVGFTGLPERNSKVLLHGDYWSGNILWKDEQLAGIIDWEDAQVGNPLRDVANTRLEILWAFGTEAMQQFTYEYRSMIDFDFSDLPYWDLIAALKPAFKLAEWAGDEDKERDMREKHKLFVQQALTKLVDG